eukprot:7864551-Pyramimonas_sp.AAC.1
MKSIVGAEAPGRLRLTKLPTRIFHWLRTDPGRIQDGSRGAAERGGVLGARARDDGQHVQPFAALRRRCPQARAPRRRVRRAQPGAAPDARHVPRG